MILAVLASTIALVHALLIALVMGGALVATTPRVIPRFPRWLVVAYLVAVGLTLLSHLFFGSCLMTAWEKELRNQIVPGSAYQGTFLQHYFGFLPSSVTKPGHFAPWFGIVLAATAWAFLQLRRRGGESTQPSSPPPEGSLSIDREIDREEEVCGSIPGSDAT